jgi:hypothetical protein
VLEEKESGEVNSMKIKALAHQGARGENNVKAVEVLLVNEPAARPATPKPEPKTLFGDEP